MILEIVLSIVVGLLAIWITYMFEERKQIRKEIRHVKGVCYEYEKELHTLKEVEKMLEKGYVLVSPKKAKELEKND